MSKNPCHIHAPLRDYLQWALSVARANRLLDEDRSATEQEDAKRNRQPVLPLPALTAVQCAAMDETFEGVAA